MVRQSTGTDEMTQKASFMIAIDALLSICKIWDLLFCVLWVTRVTIHYATNPLLCLWNVETMEEEHLLSFYAVENDVSEDDEDDEATTNEDESSSSAPPGWKLERSTKATGRFFYFNVESRLKYWQDLSLPYGWAVEYSETDHKTYINMITGERTLKKPRNKNQISPDAHAKHRGRKISRGGSFGSNNSAEKHRQRSGSGDASVNDWKLVFSEKFKQRYYFNPQTKKQFWRVENTPEGWAFEWKGKNKSYFNK